MTTSQIVTWTLAAVLIFSVAAMIFWAIFEQAGSTIALFGDQKTRTTAFGHEFPSAWFQSLNYPTSRPRPARTLCH